MHRYDADTVGRVRTDYLHRAQKYVETAMQSAQYTIDNASSASEKSKATRAVCTFCNLLCCFSQTNAATQISAESKEPQAVAIPIGKRVCGNHFEVR